MGGIASGVASHVEGYGSVTAGAYSHAEGYRTTAQAQGSHSEGYNTTAKGQYSHSEGYETVSEGRYAHAEGAYTDAIGSYSHAEGYGDYNNLEITISGDANATTYQIVSGYTSTDRSTGVHVGSIVHYGTDIRYIVAVDQQAHTITLNGTLSSAAITERVVTVLNSGAAGDYSHAEGKCTLAGERSSHAEGEETASLAQGSHSEGLLTVAGSDYQHVTGRLNVVDFDDKYAYIIGNGALMDVHNGTPYFESNAHTVAWDGTGWFQGDVYVGGESQDDTNAKKLATEEFVDNAIASIPTADLNLVNGAGAGSLRNVKAAEETDDYSVAQGAIALGG